MTLDSIDWIRLRGSVALTSKTHSIAKLAVGGDRSDYFLERVMRSWLDKTGGRTFNNNRVRIEPTEVQNRNMNEDSIVINIIHNDNWVKLLTFAQAI